MKKLAAVAILGVVAAPFAVQAGSPAPAPVEAPIAVPAPVVVAPGFDWTGFYVGGQLGYGDLSGGGYSPDGMLYGVHAGYNYDFGNWVLGGEVAHNWADVKATDFDMDRLTELKVKAGFEAGTTLFYGTIGAAWADATIAGTGYSDNGYLAGVGVDMPFGSNWIGGIEAVYHDFSDFDGTGVDLDGYSVKAKVSYRF